MLHHLSMALHENEGSVRGKLILALLGDGPSLFGGVVQVAFVSTHDLQLNLNFALHVAANGEAVLCESVQNDLLLDEVFVLIGGDPGEAGA
jgi:hypothetical protein